MIQINRYHLNLNEWTEVNMPMGAEILTALEEVKSGDLQRRVFVHVLEDTEALRVPHRLYLAGVGLALPSLIERKYYVSSFTLLDGHCALHLFDLGEKT